VDGAPVGASLASLPLGLADGEQAASTTTSAASQPIVLNFITVVSPPS
jgi:hypothetical protein